MIKDQLKPSAYDYNDQGRVAAARHCDRLREFAQAIDAASGERAVAIACMYLHENQSSVASYAGLTRSRLSELKRKKKPTNADKNALLGAFARRWII